MGDDGVEYRLARTAEEFRWCLVNNVSVKLIERTSTSAGEEKPTTRIGTGLI